MLSIRRRKGGAGNHWTYSNRQRRWGGASEGVEENGAIFSGSLSTPPPLEECLAILAIHCAELLAQFRQKTSRRGASVLAFPGGWGRRNLIFCPAGRASAEECGTD